MSVSDNEKESATIKLQRSTIESLTAERDRLAAELAELRAQEPVAWAISYGDGIPYRLADFGDGPLLDAEIARHGGTCVKMPLYAAPVPAAVPDDETAKTRLKMEIKRACEYYQQAGRVGSAAPMLARQHKHTADKIIDTALAAAQKGE